MDPTTRAGAVPALNLEALDGESMLLALQAERGKLLDDKLREFAGGVRSRNEQIGRALGKIEAGHAHAAELKASIAELSGTTIPAAEAAVESAQAERAALVGEKTALESASKKVRDLDAWVVSSAPEGEGEDRVLSRSELDALAAAGLPLDGVTYDESGTAHAGAVAFAQWHEALDGDRIPALQSQIDAKAGAIAACDTRIESLAGELDAARATLARNEAALPVIAKEIEHVGKSIEQLGDEQKQDVQRLRSVIDRHRSAFEDAAKDIRSRADQRGEKISDEAYRRAMDELKTLSDRRLDEVQDAVRDVSPEARRREGLTSARDRA